MRTYRVEFADEAEKDLANIETYIARDSPENARRFVARLVLEVNDMATIPQHNAVEGWARRSPVRTLPVWPYVVYFRVDEVRRVVRILTVRHGARRRPRNVD